MSVEEGGASCYTVLMAYRTKTWEEILFYNLSKLGRPIDEHECWEWQSTKDKDGYGLLSRKILKTRKSKQYRAHRIAYETWIGLVGNMNVLHKCDNPSCINPSHLFLGTAADNNKDKIVKGRDKSPSGENHWSKKKPQIRNHKGQFSK